MLLQLHLTPEQRAQLLSVLEVVGRELLKLSRQRQALMGEHRELLERAKAVSEQHSGARPELANRAVSSGMYLETLTGH